MASPRRPYYKFVSECCLDEQTLLPVAAALILGWTLAGAAFVTSLWVLPFNLGWGVGLLIATCLFVVRLYINTNRISSRSTFRYEFVITRTEAMLFVHDVVDERQIVQSIALKQVSVAEIFSVGNISDLTLIGQGRNLQIPLSLFGAQSERIVRALSSCGVLVVSMDNNVVRIAA
ncbi:MAG TPA: hypothetical protein V6D22_01855 [Candidatus Obscuribacterales bacterium]